MNERKSIGKKKRFDVFKRDAFACQYCGRSTPTVTLEVDHILPVSKGGLNVMHNLITACFDCNRGKGAGLIEKAPESLSEQIAERQEHEEQVKAYERMLKARERRLNKAVNAVEERFQELFESERFTMSFRSSVRTFVERLSEQEACDAMSYAVSRIGGKGPSQVGRYFCGICWGKIRDREA